VQTIIHLNVVKMAKMHVRTTILIFISFFFFFKRLKKIIDKYYVIKMCLQVVVDPEIIKMCASCRGLHLSIRRGKKKTKTNNANVSNYYIEFSDASKFRELSM